jgi:hypothetical protein
VPGALAPGTHARIVSRWRASEEEERTSARCRRLYRRARQGRGGRVKARGWPAGNVQTTEGEDQDLGVERARARPRPSEDFGHLAREHRRSCARCGLGSGLLGRLAGLGDHVRDASNVCCDYLRVLGRQAHGGPNWPSLPCCSLVGSGHQLA